MLYSKHPTLTVLSCTIGVVLALAGCASVTGSTAYPISWAEIDSRLTADGCPKVEGTYSNRGAQSFPAELGEPPRLSEIFARLGQGTGPFSPRANKQVWPVLPESVSVRIAQTPETLMLTFLSENQEQASLEFRRYHFNWNEKRFDDLFTCYASGKEPRLRFLAEPETRSTILPGVILGAVEFWCFCLRRRMGR